MVNYSLYVSGQTELKDVNEFFQKRLMGEGENPIAFFDGVFYESHQERVGNIVYQDYLIYTDRAIYLWARGASKDYLDRFTLGTVSVNSRNKDSAFATLNIKIRRVDKEPIYVIFDMVEISEAETITRLQTVVESTIEGYLGMNYRQEIPQATAERILHDAAKICPPRSLTIPQGAAGSVSPDAKIGYGQDLLEQYKASIGYNAHDQSQKGAGAPSGAGEQGGRGLPGAEEAIRGIESLLPTDPASIKRIASSIKDLVGDAPFRLREQVMKDLQHVPGDVATVLTAVNELLSNIADNPQAERFVINAIKTAVRNDGVLGSISKIIKLTSGGSGGAKKSYRPAAGQVREEDRERRGGSQQDADDRSGEGTIRRQKIGADREEGNNRSADTPNNVEATGDRSPLSGSAGYDDVSDGGIRRKKIVIRNEDDNSADAEIARRLMSYDELSEEQPHPEGFSEDHAGNGGIRKKKIVIRPDDGEGADGDAATVKAAVTQSGEHDIADDVILSALKGLKPDATTGASGESRPSSGNSLPK